MTDDDKTPEAKPVKKATPATVKKSVAPEPVEPKQESASPVGAEPVTRNIAPGAVIGPGATDDVVYSKARVPGPTEGRKSLTVLHIQRRLAEEGFAEAASAPGGRYEALTTRAVQAYQSTLGAEVTGVLTRGQFEELFRGDPNVTVTVDTHVDHQV